MITGARRATLTAAEVSAGCPLRPLKRTITLTDMVAYGGATWDWHRGHYDPAHAAGSGLPGPSVDGQMPGGLLAKQFVDTFGPRARLRRVAFRFHSMVFAGHPLTFSGEVPGILPGPDGAAVAASQRICCGDRVVVDKASAEVVLPS